MPGASTLGAANANYGDLAQLWAQYTGKITHNLIQKYTEIAQLRIQPFIGKFMDDRKAAAGLSIINDDAASYTRQDVSGNDGRRKDCTRSSRSCSRDEMGQKFVNSDALSKGCKRILVNLVYSKLRASLLQTSWAVAATQCNSR